MRWKFVSENADFVLENPDKTSYLYFPLVNEAGMMSSITPTLNGDLKSGQNSFLLLPVSAEDLHNTKSTRNFWIYINKKDVWSISGNSPMQLANFYSDKKDDVTLEAGFLWHKIIRKNKVLGVKAEIINFVPVEHKVEIMEVTITNTSNQVMQITPTAAIPIYGRSADNLRDHRHVTSLLHRIRTNDYGVLVKPTLSFDERGHKINNVLYSVLGFEENGEKPIGFLPEVEEFIGEGGSFETPEAIFSNKKFAKSGNYFEGYEAIGAIRFKDIDLKPNESKTYIILMSISEDELENNILLEKFGSKEKVKNALEENKKYWENKISNPEFKTSDDEFNKWMKWINIQPILRRLFGNSFLPHHDYGRGGRGWRDLWQDLLALLMMEPDNVRKLLYNNYAGVRIDGSNATIIGSNPGEFIADRNNIARMWMDHGAWPFLTTKLYIDLTGDLNFLLESQTYFKDRLANRCTDFDPNWTIEKGNKLKTRDNKIHSSSILEHILIQHLTPFFNVGMHNNIKLEGADWNDGLDMARNNGESVAFTALYGWNLLELAKLLKSLKIEELEITEEILMLLDNKVDYNSPEEKNKLLNEYYNKVKSFVSGNKTKIKIDYLISDLERKGNWIVNHIRKNEWIRNNEGYEWFNGYYDDHGNIVEGDNPKGVRMTLTGQVFTIMGNIATNDQVEKILLSAKKYLKDEKVGGYRLNTNFHEVKLDLGRLFGFAFGHKENGAMFSHMAVMFSNALYKRGFVEDGFDVINTLYNHIKNFEVSRIYPGIPEYINEKGRGMYHYLTGSASWLLLTVLTEMFGVKGDLGDLLLEPKLLDKQFDCKGIASVKTLFADRTFNIIYSNKNRLNYGKYNISSVSLNGRKIESEILGNKIKIKRSLLESLDKDKIHELIIELE
ncbi:cellobiose phosphorylase [Marinitoga sp. 38H-ov]|uniref:GH36-type glycosyl hydrolase domain-containing protein n=1 Tax=Marinitoga sp. 38H-ov TaxID=1755814 RepID=UPI0013E9DB7E|nr:cellobiose phosphorylase [Marinitoga sp. 38H-ov]KAF2955369.1 cellobiose phosphorylase [Marinitoga sp. 38H-ov]